MTFTCKVPGLWYKCIGLYIWYDILCILSIGIISAFKDIFTRAPKPDFEKLEKRTGQVAVITGGPRGLALGLVKRLVQLDYDVIMGVRNIKDSKERLCQFANSNKDLNFSKVKFLEMDLSSLDSVRAFAIEVLQETSRVDLLLCNAAIMRAPYQITVDGYESHIQVNYLSNFLLIHLLIKRLKETAVLKGAHCQIIISSSVAYSAGKFYPRELEKPLEYTPYKFYFSSKLYTIMSMVYLQRLLNNEGAKVHCYAIHPGMIPTDMWYSAGGYLAFSLGMLAHKIFRNIENGADTILWPALSPEYLRSGGYYMEAGVPVNIANKAKDESNQALLYSKSLEMAAISWENDK